MRPAREGGGASHGNGMSIDASLARKPSEAAAGQRALRARGKTRRSCRYPIAAVLSARPSKPSGLTCLVSPGKILLAIFSRVTRRLSRVAGGHYRRLPRDFRLLLFEAE